MAKKFQFDLFRLNVVDDDRLTVGTYISSDAQIGALLDAMATSSFDIPVTARKTTSTWGVRQFESFALKDSAGTETVHRILLVRSLEEQDGDTLTDAGISAARSAINPPLATSVSLYIWMRRHLVAIEHNSALLSGTAWRRAFLKISERGAKKLTYRSCFVLEPIPEAGTLTALLNSFTRVTRIKLKVRIPNSLLKKS